MNISYYQIIQKRFLNTTVYNLWWRKILIIWTCYFIVGLRDSNFVIILSTDIFTISLQNVLSTGYPDQQKLRKICIRKLSMYKPIGKPSSYHSPFTNLFIKQREKPLNWVPLASIRICQFGVSRSLLFTAVRFVTISVLLAFPVEWGSVNCHMIREKNYTLGMNYSYRYCYRSIVLSF